ncbi:MAG TPA: DinB family protein [Longilinea sp.]|nr:DinB family protein [Longilinea sp.]
MKRQQVLEKIDTSWNEFVMAYADLSDTQLTQPGVTGDWSVKDLIAHVSWWEEESLKHLPLILKGLPTPRYSVLYGGIDAFNAQMTELKRNTSLSEVLKEAAATHQKLIEYLSSIPDEQFTSETRFRRRLGYDSFKHYPIHTAAILAWRENQM